VLFRRGSFHQQEADLQESFLRQWIVLAEPFREGRLRYSHGRFALEPPEAMFVAINQRSKRNQVLRFINSATNLFTQDLVLSEHFSLIRLAQIRNRSCESKH
jgi:hypothetical protein